MRLRGAVLPVLLLPGVVQAAVQDWRVNEVCASVSGDASIQFVELYAPPSATADNCFFPTTRIELYDAAGVLKGSTTPFATTTCYGGDTYFLFATPEAASHFGVERDAGLTFDVPADAGQLCFRSSATRYDCTRWGTITTAVADLSDPDDTTSAAAFIDGLALARYATTGVVATDFILQTPTPRGPNDGSPWSAPDGGPDATLPPDAATWDAQIFPDAPPVNRSDARDEPPTWLSADPGGGVVCACRVGMRARSPGGPALALLALAALALRRRGRRQASPLRPASGLTR